ncbi:MptD family putative ECF transporter S component [Rubneribacter sp.]
MAEQMRTTAASKGLKARDFATLGIFSALLFVLTMVVGMLMNNPLALVPWAPTVIAVVGGPLYLMMPAKVGKRGAILVPALVIGVIWALMGGMFVLVGMVIAGIVGEIIVTRTNYKSFAAMTVAYVLFIVAYHFGSVSIAWIVSDYFTQFASYPAEIAAMMEGAINSLNGYVSIMASVAGALVGALFGRAVLKKHFVAAGVVQG